LTLLLGLGVLPESAMTGNVVCRAESTGSEVFCGAVGRWRIDATKILGC
jgi:hypothetical protein